MCVTVVRRPSSMGSPLSSTTFGLPTLGANPRCLPCAGGRKAQCLHGLASCGMSAAHLYAGQSRAEALVRYHVYLVVAGKSLHGRSARHHFGLRSSSCRGPPSADTFGHCH